MPFQKCLIYTFDIIPTSSMQNCLQGCSSGLHRIEQVAQNIIMAVIIPVTIFTLRLQLFCGHVCWLKNLTVFHRIQFYLFRLEDFLMVFQWLIIDLKYR